MYCQKRLDAFHRARSASGSGRTSRLGEMRLLAVLFCATIAAAQHPRDSWKLPAISLEEPLPHSLADAPLSAAEREQVFSALYNRMHDDRKMIMSTRIG